MFAFCSKHLLIAKGFRSILTRPFFNISGVKYNKDAACSPRPPQRVKIPHHIVDQCDMFEIPKGHARRYRKQSYFMMAVIAGLAFQVFTNHEEPEREFVPFEHMYIHTKGFFWGDQATSMFHGPYNYLPDDELPNYDKNHLYPHEKELQRRKELRETHAKEELERRKHRRELEALEKPPDPET